jgi:glycosyltransferase involved in cell wall biosynthesis
MNVAIFASAFHPHVGGVEELCRQLAHAYIKRGMGVIVITNRWPRNLPEFESVEGIPVHRIAMRIPDGSLKAQVNAHLTSGLIRRNMLNILRENKIDILHVQCVSSNGAYALHAQRELGLPLVLTAQGERTMDATNLYQRSSYMNKILRDCITEADYVTACSRHTLDDLEEYYGKPLSLRANVVYNGVNLEDFDGIAPYDHPRPYVLGIGRMVPQKGFDTLMEAFALADPSLHELLLAGDGPERPALEQRAKMLGLENRVRFLGRCDRLKSVALFKGCSFFVLPSRYEPLGIVNLEAMAAGRAAIATDVGGVPELVVHEQTGLLVPADNPPAMAAAMRRLFEDLELRVRLSRGGLNRVRGFGWGSIAEQYRLIYSHVLETKKAREPAALVGSPA